jgi:hypothetical protein
MGYLARNLACSDCNLSFAFSVDEQGLGAELGFENPRRCGSCRNSLEDRRRAFRHNTMPRLNGLRAGLRDGTNVDTPFSIATTDLRA